MIGRRAARQSEPITVGDSNGLSLSDEHALREILLKAECLEPCRAYLGGAERQKLDDLVRDTRLRLTPTAVSELTERADAFFGMLAGQFDWGKRALGVDDGQRTHDSR